MGVPQGRSHMQYLLSPHSPSCARISPPYTHPKPLQSSLILPFPCLHIPCAQVISKSGHFLSTLWVSSHQLEEHRAPLCLWEPLSLGPGCQDCPAGWVRAAPVRRAAAVLGPVSWALSEPAGFSCTHLWALPSLQRPLAPVGDFLSLPFSSPAGAPFLSALLGPHLQRPPVPGSALSGRGKDRVPSASRLCRL